MKKISKQKVNTNYSTVACRRITTIDKLQLKCYIGDSLLNYNNITNNITIEEIPSKDEFSFDKTDERFYKNYFKILYKNEPVAVILNNTKTYQGTNSLLIFLNHTFYSNFNEFYKELIYNDTLIFNDLKLYKLDIALDLNKCFMRRLNSINIKRCQKKIYLKKNMKFKEYELEQSYYIGSKQYINIYDKLKQLESVTKPYIEDYYLGNGFNLDKGVTRIELRIEKRKGGFIERELSKVDIDKLTDNKYISDISNNIFDKKLVVVYRGKENINRGRRNNEKLINIDFTYDADVINYTDYIYKNKPSVKTIKSDIKKSFFNWMRLGGGDIESDLYVNIMEFVENYRLERWFNNFINNTTSLNREYRVYIKKYYK